MVMKMRVDDPGEQIEIWHIGNTGLRNPNRLQEGFIAFSESPFVGQLHGKHNERGFQSLLNSLGLIKNQQGNDETASYARKWRLMFERYGFIYPCIGKKGSPEQEQLGLVDTITPMGRLFLKASSIPEVQECFLRGLSVEQYELSGDSQLFSPFRWILALMLELENRTGDAGLSRIEFALWGQTTNPTYDLNEVVEHIIDFRNKRSLCGSKRDFDREAIKSRGERYKRKKDNFLDYCDMNLRYLRMSGVIQRKGRGITIAASKHAIAEALAKTTVLSGARVDQIKKLTAGAPLPTDDITVAIRALKELQSVMRGRGVSFDNLELSNASVLEINLERIRLENVLFEVDEVSYAMEQNERWEEIVDYMSLLIKGGGKKKYDDEHIIEVPKGEAPAYLEWVIWRALLAIDHLVNRPSDVRGFKLDSDFFPVSVAAGGRGDLYCEFLDYVVLAEVTMSTNSRQESMEGEPVRRHVADASLRYSKPVYCLFIANVIDTNTAETFRRGIWYAQNDKKLRLGIVPLTLRQFRDFFIAMFESQQVSPDNLVKLFDYCLGARDSSEAPGWKEYIESAVAFHGSVLRG